MSMIERIPDEALRPDLVSIHCSALHLPIGIGASPFGKAPIGERGPNTRETNRMVDPANVGCQIDPRPMCQTALRQPFLSHDPVDGHLPRLPCPHRSRNRGSLAGFALRCP